MNPKMQTYFLQSYPWRCKIIFFLQTESGGSALSIQPSDLQ